MRAHSSRQLHVSVVSDEDDFMLVEYFEDVVSDEGEDEQGQNIPNSESSNLHISLSDWVLVQYEGQEFPGEVTNIVGMDFEVSVMMGFMGKGHFEYFDLF